MIWQHIIIHKFEAALHIGPSYQDKCNNGQAAAPVMGFPLYQTLLKAIFKVFKFYFWDIYFSLLHFLPLPSPSTLSHDPYTTNLES